MSLHGRQPREGLHQPSDGSNRLTMGDAMRYLNEVKEEFKDTPEKYDQFLAFMKAFRAQKLDIANVVARLRYLFKGHQSLVLALNTFLPKGYEIAFPAVENPEEQQLNLNDAAKFFNKIMTRFQNDRTVTEAFVGIVNANRVGSKSIGEVYREVKELFNYQPDLVEEFKEFLPSKTPFPVCQLQQDHFLDASLK